MRTIRTALIATIAAAASLAPATALPAPTAAPGESLTYVGRVGGSDALVAIQVRDGRVLAYVCNGRANAVGTLGRWFQGRAGGGDLALVGAQGARLVATLDDDAATGTVRIDGVTRSFTARRSTAPRAFRHIVLPASGRGETAALVTRLSGRPILGWILLPDGTQRGSSTRPTGGASPGPRGTQGPSRTACRHAIQRTQPAAPPSTDPAGGTPELSDAVLDRLGEAIDVFAGLRCSLITS